MKNDMHLIPQIILDVAGSLSSNIATENERLNALVRLEAVRKYIDSVLANYERERMMKGKRR